MFTVDFSNRHRRLFGGLLVGLQFGLLLLLGLMAKNAIWQGGLPMSSLALAVGAIVLGTWTLVHNRLGNFNIRPQPKNTGILVTTGPYHRIRHPMYSAVLLGAAAMALPSHPWGGISAWLALALVLWIKAGVEERWMCEQHSAYAAYCGVSKRFVPWLI